MIVLSKSIAIVSILAIFVSSLVCVSLWYRHHSVEGEKFLPALIPSRLYCSYQTSHTQLVPVCLNTERCQVSTDTPDVGGGQLCCSRAPLTSLGPGSIRLSHRGGGGRARPAPSCLWTYKQRPRLSQLLSLSGARPATDT